MSYEFYKAYLTTASPPSVQYQEDLQAMVDTQIDNASSYFTIKEEISVGSFTWQDTNVRINHVVYSDTGEKLGDDFKSIIFQDFSHAKAMGYRYQFDDNYWITVNCDQKKYVTASAVIRRANNIMQKYNANGVLIQEPCCVDYGITYDQFGMGKSIVLPDGEIDAIVQNNLNTSIWRINDRFIFGGQVFRIQSYENLRNATTFGINNNPLIIYRMEKVNSAPGDDLINNIPASNLNFTLEINQNNFNNIIGYSSTLSTTVKCNGTVVTEGVTWSSSDATKVSVTSGGVITCLALGSAVITAKMTDNVAILDTITITVVASTTPVSEIRISPAETYIIQGDSKTYTVYMYKNDVQQADTFTISTSGVATSKYECLPISGNSFSVRNIETDDNVLVVRCTDNIDATYKEIQITLGGLW